MKKRAAGFSFFLVEDIVEVVGRIEEKKEGPGIPRRLAGFSTCWEALRQRGGCRPMKLFKLTAPSQKQGKER